MKQILVIQNKRIGDVLISSVIADNIKIVFPDSEITYFVYDYTAGVLENHPAIDHVIRVNEQWLKKIPNYLRTVNRLRRKKFDIIFDPYAKMQSRLICYFSGAPFRIGFKRPGKKLKLPFYTHPVHFLPAKTKPCGKAIENRINLITSVFELNAPLYSPRIVLKPEEEPYTDLQHIKRPVVMVGVLGSTPQKSMPYPYIAALVDHISDTYSCTILFNYAPQQRSEAEKIYELCQSKDAINLDIYEDSIRGFIRLMNSCDLLVANEGGSVHIAKALNKPTFTIYSPYIEKEDWNSFEDGKQHESIHLLEEKPELYSGFTREKRKGIEADPTDFYMELTPAMILQKMKPFLEQHLKPAHTS